jgi:hypothetical protein
MCVCVCVPSLTAPSIWRGTGQMFQYDDMAAAVVRRTLASGVLDRMPPLHRIFACFAMSHQVCVVCVVRCVCVCVCLFVCLTVEARSPLHLAALYLTALQESKDMQACCLEQWQKISHTFSAGDPALDSGATFKRSAVCVVACRLSFLVPFVYPSHKVILSLCRYSKAVLSNSSVIARFGRFPGRNVLLARQSTPDELAFLYSSDLAVVNSRPVVASPLPSPGKQTKNIEAHENKSTTEHTTSKVSKLLSPDSKGARSPASPGPTARQADQRSHSPRPSPAPQPDQRSRSPRPSPAPQPAEEPHKRLARPLKVAA